jgi:exodeoxyribonuclease III
MIKIAAWNVNSVRARIDRLLEWLQSRQPDIVLLQETKCEDHQFPFEALGDLGYEVAHFGQKTYNGVAILSKTRPVEVVRGFADGAEDDPSRRVLWARFEDIGLPGPLWVASLYAPNGQKVGSDKYAYKLGWYERLAKTLPARVSSGALIVLGGDYNVAPADIDVHDPAAWHEQVLCSTPERAALRSLLDAGFKDAFRETHPERQAFSWWDYRMLGFPKNLGLRIDHLLMNERALSACAEIDIDREARKGENPSDHAPIVAELR